MGSIALHDKVAHHPLGAASYYFKTALVQYLNNQCPRSPVAIHIGSQPNCSPHIGNITTFATGFSIAAALKEQYDREVRVVFVLVDTAPSPNANEHAPTTIDGVNYQRSLKQTGDLEQHTSPLIRVLQRLSELSDIPYGIETQSLWRSTPVFASILQKIVAQRDFLGPRLSPETGRLAIRASCPQCGLADKHGINNRYDNDGRTITFSCPQHGDYIVDMTCHEDLQRLEFNTPLRNLIRILICSQDTTRSWIMCTGSDYAGFYQEQLLWRLLEGRVDGPVICYAPLILDWSGGKLSKSLYVETGAYQYLVDSGRGYMLDADVFLGCEGGSEALFEEVREWVRKPYKLFRDYSVEYMDFKLRERGMRVL
ncbi:uncharacterized protein BDV17DRAFT_287924 [Aspergillus undulatus]|uniref:uncharacterized protein n=1 Tax=Aspergillus undulatus TaxID=1810928 RepID=UPI003CCDCC07